MEIFNTTPFRIAPLGGRINFPGHSLTLIVKGTFDLKPGHSAAQADEQLYPTGDEYCSGDDDMLGGPRYEMDFACFKPRADLLLVGKCHAPGGTPVPACRATFQVGPLSRTLAVFGDRYWTGALGLNFCSDPEPFTVMELKYENSFGGAGYDKNPVGKGAGKLVTAAREEVRPLPNIEDPEDLITSPDSRPEPAGFGPLNRMWQQRFAKTGTYDKQWLQEGWPGLPADFDWSHFNASPENQQVEGYLRGDEALYFENLHPQYPQYRSQLPGQRIRCFTHQISDPESREAFFEEVPMNLDTLWVDMESERLVLVWRGWVEVTSEDYEEEIEHLFLMSEQLDQAPQTTEQCRQRYLSVLEEYEREWEMTPEKPQTDEKARETTAMEAATEAGPDVTSPDAAKDLKMDAAEAAATQKEKDALIKDITVQSSALLAQLGIAPDSLPPEVLQGQAGIISRLTEDDPEKIAVMAQEEMETQIRTALAKMGIDFDHLPAVSEKAKAEQIRFMKALGMGDTASVEASSSGFWAILAALLPKAGLDPEDLTPLIEETRKHLGPIREQLDIEEEKEARQEPKAVPLTREVVRELAGRGASFAGQDLHGLDLSNLELKGVDFARANLSGVSLVKADLAGAILSASDLTNADLSGANLENAVLSGADLSDVKLGGCSFSGADLSAAVLAKVDLSGADLTRNNLTNAHLFEALLVGTNLTGANLSGADFSKANLERALLNEADAAGADFTGANLTGATLTDALLEKTKMAEAVLDAAEAGGAYFTEADLCGASLRSAKLPAADFSRCLLHGADFQGADLDETNIYGARGNRVNFSEANLSRLRASEGCDFSESSFVKASGLESVWHQANLTGADFSFCEMEGADLSGACLERANFFAADMKFARFRKADLKQASLVQMNLFKGVLEKADLTGADLRQSNFYGAEFSEAVVEDALLEGANLKMTKLAGWKAQIGAA